MQRPRSASWRRALAAAADVEHQVGELAGRRGGRGRAEVVGEPGSNHRHREHGARELHGRASAAELSPPTATSPSSCSAEREPLRESLLTIAADRTGPHRRLELAADHLD